MHEELLTAAPKGTKCPCVGKHVPLPTVLHLHHIVPTYMGGSDDAPNKIYICPTAHYNTHDLIRKYEKYKGVPPGSVRKHYSDFVQDLAAQAWNGRVRKTNGTDSE